MSGTHLILKAGSHLFLCSSHEFSSSFPRDLLQSQTASGIYLALVSHTCLPAIVCPTRRLLQQGRRQTNSHLGRSTLCCPLQTCVFTHIDFLCWVSTSGCFDLCLPVCPGLLGAGFRTSALPKFRSTTHCPACASGCQALAWNLLWFGLATRPLSFPCLFCPVVLSIPGGS